MGVIQGQTARGVLGSKGNVSKFLERLRSWDPLGLVSSENKILQKLHRNFRFIESDIINCIGQDT